MKVFKASELDKPLPVTTMSPVKIAAVLFLSFAAMPSNTAASTVTKSSTLRESFAEE